MAIFTFVWFWSDFFYMCLYEGLAAIFICDCTL